MRPKFWQVHVFHWLVLYPALMGIGFFIVAEPPEPKPTTLSIAPKKDVIAGTFRINPYGLFTSFLKAMHRDEALTAEQFQRLAMQVVEELEEGKGDDKERMLAVYGKHATGSDIRHYLHGAIQVMGEQNLKASTSASSEAQALIDRFGSDDPNE